MDQPEYVEVAEPGQEDAVAQALIVKALGRLADHALLPFTFNGRNKKDVRVDMTPGSKDPVHMHAKETVGTIELVA